MREASGTKIIATVGPSSRDKRVLAEMVKAGVDGFRINCSHTRAGELRDLVGDIEAVGGGFTIADLAGRKLRCNHKLVARAGETLILGGTENPFNNEIEGVQVGAAVWVGDGNLIGYVEHLEGDEISVRVERGVETNDGVAVHVAGVSLVGDCIDDGDVEMLEAAIEAGCDWIALSYVKDGIDAEKAVNIVNNRAGVIAKIERESAVADIEGICKVVDAIMIARGDLGVELDYVQVPKAQRDVFEYCRSIGMPVVCATEMLGSMATASRPTRAEVSDVEGTMRLGYDAIVLTAETAMGQDPVKVVEVAGRIRAATELDSIERNAGRRSDDGAIAEAAVTVGEEIEVEAIVVLTSTGRTARLVAAERPRLASYAVAGERGIARRISLYYGILAVLAEREGGVEASAGAILRTLVANGSITAGAKCVLVGSRVGPDQDADLIMIRRAV